MAQLPLVLVYHGPLLSHRHLLGVALRHLLSPRRSWKIFSGKKLPSIWPLPAGGQKAPPWRFAEGQKWAPKKLMACGNWYIYADPWMVDFQRCKWAGLKKKNSPMDPTKNRPQLQNQGTFLPSLALALGITLGCLVLALGPGKTKIKNINSWQFFWWPFWDG